MKTRILTIAMGLIIGMMFSNPVEAGKRNSNIASCLENAIDPSKTIESWMVSDLVWTPSEMIRMFTVKEKALQIEDWMFNPSVWIKIENAEDKESGIEGWMTNNLYWERPETAVDNTIQIASWMTDVNYWLKQPQISDPICERVLKVENWMVDANIWKS